jgi:hypothetical protein
MRWKGQNPLENQPKCQPNTHLCGSKLCELEAVNEEAIDYVLHFCGLECYAKWQKHEQKQEASE